jgi:DNA-binding MarR family transcriptional regulator
MEKERFGQFIKLIDSIRKSINKLKFENATYLGMKSVNVLWVYELLQHPEGLSASALAANSMVNRSLVCREIEQLRTDGFITCDSANTYNVKYYLTERGVEMAHNVCERAMDLQQRAGDGVSEEELESFYNTLEKLNRNLHDIAIEVKEQKQ